MASGLYAEELPGLIEAGEIKVDALDKAVLRVLRAKQALGLFDDPYRDSGRPHESPPPRALAREVARRCPVLLKNDGMLPLRSGQRVALIGPFAREHGHLNGAWALFADNAGSVNLAEGLAAAGGIGALIVEPGSDIEAPIEGGIAAAEAAAAAADVVLLALGEGQHMSGESRSRVDPSLPGAQLALARAIRRMNKPVAILLRCGRPLVIPELTELCDALLVTWFLGAETGHAVADLLTGRAAPSGRLPMSFPRHIGQIPIYYARTSTGRPAAPAPGRFTARYIDCEPGPLFPFGFGLGYGRVRYGKTEVDAGTLEWEGTLSVSCRVAETAGTAVEEVAQLYIHDVAAGRVRPVRELKNFRKFAIPAHGEVEIRFVLTRQDLAFHDGEASLTEAGEFEIWIAPHAEAGEPTRFTLAAPR